MISAISAWIGSMQEGDAGACGLGVAADRSSQAGLQGKAFSSSGKFHGSHAADGSPVGSLLIAELWQTVLSAASVSN